MIKDIIQLYHYSNKDIQGKIKKCYFGYNDYTTRDKNICGINRIYLYNDKNKIEYHLINTKFLYIININKTKLYDITKDNKKVKQKYNNINDIILHIIKLGYTGIYYAIGDIVITCIFYDIMFKQKIKL